MAERIRWGILSTANIARKCFVPGVAASRNGTVAAIASRNAAKARAAAEQLGIPKAYGSYEELLADPEIDAIYIGLPNSLHAEWTMKCADAGKAVLCEKPLAVSADEARRTIAYCASRDVPLMEAFMYRFHPQHAAVRGLIDAGEIGDLRAARLAFTFSLEPFPPANVRLQAELGGGALMDVGCYCVNAACMLFGESPQWASGQWDYRPEFGVEIALAATLGFSGERFAVFDCGFRGWGRGRYGVAGTSGAIEVFSAFVPRENEPSRVTLASASGTRDLTFDGVDQYRLEAEAFAAALQTGSAPPLSLDDAVRTLSVIEALHASARAGGARVAVT